MRTTTHISVVLAEDDEDDINFVTEAFRDSNIPHKLTTVNDGQKLINLLIHRGKNEINAEEPDCIILDLNMPKLDGFGALQRIKSDSTLKGIPVFVLTTSTNNDDRIKAMKLGAEAFYSKTFKFNEIVHIVTDVCARVAKTQV